MTVIHDMSTTIKARNDKNGLRTKKKHTKIILISAKATNTIS